MEPRLHLVAFLIATFLLAYCPLASSRDLPSGGETQFLQEPEDTYYVVKRKPATITCQARNADDISFTCGGTRIPPTSVEVEDMSETDPDVMQASIEVTRSDVGNYDSSDGSDYWCECSAVNTAQGTVVASRRANIKIAHLKRQFKIEPIATTAAQGQDIELICGAPAGEPTPVIIWRKDQKRVQLKGNDRITMTDQGSLVIEDVQMKDAGKYQCIARSMAGRRESQEAFLNVTDLAEAAAAEEEVSRERNPSGKPKAVFISPPAEEYYIKVNDTFTIDCTAQSADIVTFRCNGERADRKRQNITDTKDAAGNRILASKLNLTYKDVRAFMDKNQDTEKVYQCQCIAWYEDGTAERGWSYITSSEKVGKVFVKFLDSAFKQEPKDLEVGVGYDATLMCEPPMGAPQPWVHWYKDGQKINLRSSNRYQIDAKGNLVIQQVEYSDRGRYNCVAENELKRVQSRAATLTVSALPPSTTPPPTTQEPKQSLAFPDVIPDSPVWLQDLETENSIQDDGVATLVCTVVSAHQLSINCNKRRLSENEFNVTRKRDKPSKKLLMSIITEIGAGDVAQNPDDYSCFCTAWFRKDRAWIKMQSNTGYVRENIKPYIGDEFVYPPSDIDVDYEGEAELSCEPPEGKPTPTVYWLKDGEKIDSQKDSNYVILAEGTLILEYVRLQDEGSYTCVAENAAGTKASAPVTLTVLGKPTSPTPMPDTTFGVTSPGYSTMLPTDDDYDFSLDLMEPVFTYEPEEENYMMNSEDVVLRCIVFNAESLLFACNNETITASAKTGFSTIDPQTGKKVFENLYTITSAMLDAHTHKEPYTCACQGYFKPEGEDEWAYLESRTSTIQRAFLRRRFKKLPIDTSAKVGASVELMCTPPEGVPRPTVQWIKDGFAVYGDERITITEEGHLIINELSQEDEGDYTCSAANIFRKRTSPSVRLTITAVDATSGPIAEPESTPEGTGHPEPEPEPSTADPEPEPRPEPEPEAKAPPKGTPFISKDLHSAYYVIKNKPTTIICQATDVSSISFNCGMKDIPQDQVTEEASVHEVILPSGEADYVEVIEGSIAVSKDDVADFFGEFYCVCRAHYTMPGNATAGTGDSQAFIESQKGYVEIAYLKKHFTQEPMSQRVMIGDFLSLSCQAPLGNPQPEMSWYKDGEVVEMSSMAPGSLIVSEASTSDGGEYVCVAENVAARRTSSPVVVEVIKSDTDMGGAAGGTTDSNDGTDDTDTDDVIEVEVITHVPTTTDIYDEFSTSDDMASDSTVEPTTAISQGSPEPVPEDKYSSYSPFDTDTTQSPSEEISTNQHDTDTTSTSSFETDETTTEYVSIIEIETTGDSSYPNPEPSDTSDPEPEPEPTTYLVTHSEIGLRDNQEHTYPDISEGGVNTGTPYPDTDEMSTYGDGMKVFKGVTMVDEHKMCTKVISECTSLVDSVDDICSILSEYQACIDNYVQGCTGVSSDDSVRIAQQAAQQIRDKCEMYAKCPRLNECKSVYMNSGNGLQSDLSVHTFCSDIKSFMQCADETLADCEVVMETPEEARHNSLYSVEQWFSDYCDQLVMGTPSLSSCDLVTDCTLPIEIAAKSNSTYWCGLMTSLGECTEDSLMECQMDDLLPNLHTLMRRGETACLSDDFMMGGVDKMDNKDEEEHNTRPIVSVGGVDAEEPEASKDADDRDSAISVVASVLLVTLSQIVITAIISHR